MLTRTHNSGTQHSPTERNATEIRSIEPRTVLAGTHVQHEVGEHAVLLPPFLQLLLKLRNGQAVEIRVVALVVKLVVVEGVDGAGVGRVELKGLLSRLKGSRGSRSPWMLRLAVL